MEGLEYLFNYELRVSGIIFKEDYDNKENRVLTVSEEGSLLCFPGGKLPISCIPEIKISLDSFLRKNKEKIHDELIMKKNRGKFDANDLIELFEFSRLKDLINNDKIKTGLESELYEEIGLTTNKESITHIDKVIPYTVYFEKLFSEKGLLISPIYIVEVPNPDKLVQLIDKWINDGRTEIEETMWASERDILSPSYYNTFAHSVNRVGKKLKKDGYLNGKKDNADFITGIELANL